MLEERRASLCGGGVDHQMESRDMHTAAVRRAAYIAQLKTRTPGTLCGEKRPAGRLVGEIDRRSKQGCPAP